jgi:hypothetical protein
VAPKPVVPVKVIAMDPGGGLLADAVGVELSNRDYTVIDSAETSKMMTRLGIDEVEVQMPEALSKLKAHGIDAWLTVKSAGGNDGSPQSASARMNSMPSTGRKSVRPRGASCAASHGPNCKTPRCAAALNRCESPQTRGECGLPPPRCRLTLGA